MTCPLIVNSVITVSHKKYTQTFSRREMGRGEESWREKREKERRKEERKRESNTKTVKRALHSFFRTDYLTVFYSKFNSKLLF